VKDKNIKDQLIAVKKLLPLKDGNHYSKEPPLTFLEVLLVQVSLPFMTDFKF
jgi:hypothetical protein